MAKYQGNSLPFLIKNIIKLKRKKLYWDLPVEMQNCQVKQKKPLHSCYDIFSASTQVNAMHMKTSSFENLIYFIKLLKISWEFSIEYNQRDKNGMDIIT